MEKQLVLSLLFITLNTHFHMCQPQPETPLPEANNCNGLFLSYNFTGGRIIPPLVPNNQAYRFESTINVLNRGLDELKSWRVFVGFQNNEILVSATNAVLADGTSLPSQVVNGTIFAGFPVTDLKSAIETAGDENQMGVVIQLVGTQFGVNDTEIPLPGNLTLANDGYYCQPLSKQANNRTIHTCCTTYSSFKPNSSTYEDFLPREDGDLIMMYDVIRSYQTSYWAQVSISNHNPIGRLDNWQLSWEWMRDEFIHSMKGAYPAVIDTSDCIFDSRGQFYKDMDFSLTLNCERRPTIIDLPPTKANDSNFGLIPFCCRNGTILPPSMDPSKSKSVFQMEVFKMPPDLNRTELIPPQNWNINGTMSSNYQCGSPVRVAPSRFPNPNGLASDSTAISSWQVVCNITKETSPTCCVSFSAFFNDTAVPCSTCACGCNNPSQTCSATAPALLPRPKDLQVPFDNRTDKVVEWAREKRWPVPNPLPCPDNCGVSINWHLNSDYRNGWTARITIFNWDETVFADWFAAVKMDKAGAGFETVYSFNGSVLPDSNNTLFMQGAPGLNYLVAERDGDHPRKDPKVPGRQQSIISFTKKTTPNIDVDGGDGYPSKVYFNGHECALPPIHPTNNGYKMSVASSILSLLTAITLLIMQH